MAQQDAAAPDTRNRDTGTSADRKIGGKDVTSYSFIAAMLLASFNWISQCYTEAGWFWIPPPAALSDMWAASIAPAAFIIGRIVMNRLNKLEKESEA